MYRWQFIYKGRYLLVKIKVANNHNS